MSKVKFFSNSETRFQSKAVLEQAIAIKVLGYIIGDGIVTNKEGYSFFSTAPTMVGVEMTFESGRTLEGQCFITDVAGHIIGGCKGSTEMWNGQLKLALFPNDYVW
jgi:hypothetical protein